MRAVKGHKRDRMGILSALLTHTYRTVIHTYVTNRAVSCDLVCRVHVNDRQKLEPCPESPTCPSVMAVSNCHCSSSAPWLTPLSQSCPELPRRPPSSPVHGSDLRLLSMIDYSYWQYVLDRVMLVEQKTDTIFTSLGWSSRTLRPSTSLCITTLPYCPQHVSKQLQSTSMYPITYFASHLPSRRFTVL